MTETEKQARAKKRATPKEVHKVVQLTTPIKTADIENLEIGTIVSITGVIYTSRDSAHKRIVDAMEAGEKLPFELEGQAVYYVGPSPAKPGRVIGSCGPTTSYRMDPYTPALLDKGLKAMIGKGPRTKEVIDSMVKNKAIYFAAVGGAAALISKCVKRCSVIAYPDLGPEAVHRLEVENFTCVVAIDCQGNNLYEVGKLKYQDQA